MKPAEDWIEDWVCGVDEKRERLIGRELVTIFQGFWNKLNLDSKSKSTRNRHANALHALAGHIIEDAIRREVLDCEPRRRLMDSLYDDEGPLVYHDNENYQRELDSVCRKLYKYLKAENSPS